MISPGLTLTATCIDEATTYHTVGIQHSTSAADKRAEKMVFQCCSKTTLDCAHVATLFLH